MIEFKGKKVAVLGMGVSGVYSARLLHKLGAKVILSECKKKEDVEKSLDVVPAGVEMEFGGHSDRVTESDIIVVSPGVPLNIPVLEKARTKGIPIIGELEMAFYFIPVPIIAVTGTNGKTTTTTLIGKILNADDRKIVVGGNIEDKPLSSFIDKDGSWSDAEIVVSEVSSFQLETIKEFRPKVATILNISENHLDRYNEFEDYIEAKEHILQNQKPEDFAVLNMDCPRTLSLASRTRAAVIWFSRKKEPEEGVFVRGGKVMTRFAGKENFICSSADIRLQGVHNLGNVLAAIASTLIFKVKKESILKILKEFPGLEHRLEFVTEIKGVKFIDDSKATNVDAVLRALESIGQAGVRSIILIAGGRDKGGDFGLLADFAADKLKYVILLGEAKERIKKSLVDRDSELNPRIKEVKDMREAVKTASRFAQSGDYVLLSPGCSSFDMFRDYKERGRVFKEEVLRVIESMEL